MTGLSTSQVAFRVAAAPQIGLGHVTRCLALAGRFAESTFITEASHAGSLVAMGCSSSRILTFDEGETLHTALGAAPWIEALIVDTLYSGNAAGTMREVASIKEMGLHVTVMDSMPPDHFPDTGAAGAAPDLLVTPYLSAEGLRPQPDARRWLAGAAYAVLPDGYAAAGDLPFPEVPRILVACGGADPSGLSGRIAKKLRAATVGVDVVVGPQFSGALVRELESLARNAPHISLHHGVRDMLPLYLSASVVVGRPGLLRYEVAALGRAAIYLSESEAYRPYFEAFNRSGVAEIHFTTQAHGAARFWARIAELTHSDKLMQIARRNQIAMDAVDGRGADRIAAALAADLAETRRKVQR